MIVLTAKVGRRQNIVLNFILKNSQKKILVIFVCRTESRLTGAVHLLDFFIHYVLKNSQKLLRLGPNPKLTSSIPNRPACRQAGKLSPLVLMIVC